MGVDAFAVWVERKKDCPPNLKGLLEEVEVPGYQPWEAGSTWDDPFTHFDKQVFSLDVDYVITPANSSAKRVPSPSPPAA